VTALSYALVTPSFRLDFERCSLLVESVEQWVDSSVRHYLVIDRRDVQLFTPLLKRRTQLLVVEDVVPPWIVRVPGIRRFWMSFRTRPLKNWILQQIVKLSVPSVIHEDIILNTDSDVFFVAPYAPQLQEKAGRVPLFVETGQRGLIASNDRWHDIAARLLGVPEEHTYDTNFIGNVVPWRRDNVLAMQRRLRETKGKPWEIALAPLNAFSEYILYGVFSQRVLGDASGHWQDGVLRTLNYWRTAPLNLQQLMQLKDKREPSQHSVMISAKSGTSVADIRKVFFS
jgi:hypothetical protein